MHLTVEISMYPLNEDYRALIKDFIAGLNKVDDLEVKTTATATMLYGEYHHVMQTLTTLMEWSYETHGREVFVAKFLPGYDPH